MKTMKVGIAALLGTLAAVFDRHITRQASGITPVALPNELALMNEHGVETLIIQSGVAPVASRYLLYKRGAGGANYCDICTANDTPLGISSDSPYQDGDFVNVRRLGQRKGGEIGIASGAVTIDHLVIPAAAGKIADLTLAGAGTYYVIGRCAKTVADGAEVPFYPCFPYAVTVAGNGTISVAAPA